MDGKQSLTNNRFERKKQKTKQQIVAAAMKLILKRGVDAITMEQIADEADIAKGTLYHYFPVKEAILDEYIKRVFAARNAERIARIHKLPDTRSRLNAVLGDLMKGIRAQPQIFEKYFIYRIQKMISLRPAENTQSGLGALENEIVRLGQKEGEIRHDVPLDGLIGLFEFIFIKLAQEFYQGPDKFKSRKAIAQAVELFMGGAAA